MPLLRWLVDDALPVWSSTGVDRVRGGFFETIDLGGRPLEAPRRARVVARQIYVFATAARHDWLPDADALVDHGLHFLLRRMRLDDGTFAAAVHAEGAGTGGVADGRFDLYEHAFVLFALASACRGRPDRAALRDDAEALLQRLRRSWAHPLAGFEESAPRSLPLKSNPHMHLLEAALAWAEGSAGERKAMWDALADELVGLCLTRFIDADTGALRETFDGDWQATADSAVEPGHQFEWAWLLMRWSLLRGRPDAIAAARRLLSIGEERGVDRARGVAVNALDGGLRVVDGAAKLWPQTERIKAWHAASCLADSEEEQAIARRHLDDAIAGLSRYRLTSPAGLWNEQLGVDGRFATQPCRASSLYHIVCAIDTLQSGLGDAALAPPSTSRPAA